MTCKLSSIFPWPERFSGNCPTLPAPKLTLKFDTEYLKHYSCDMDLTNLGFMTWYIVRLFIPQMLRTLRWIMHKFINSSGAMTRAVRSLKIPSTHTHRAKRTRKTSSNQLNGTCLKISASCVVWLFHSYYQLIKEY